MATEEVNPTHNQTDMNFDFDLSDFERTIPQPSCASDRAEICKGIRKVLREEGLNMY